jgi:nucleoside-diphosphate-sugar epimerase
MTQRAAVVGVTGASGLLGRAWLRWTLRADPELEVLALVRQPTAVQQSAWWQSLPRLDRDRVRWVTADLTSAASVRAVREQARTVNRAWWHFAAATTLARTPAAVEQTFVTNVNGTRHLLELLASLPSEVPLFHLSTAYVAGRRRGLITEGRPERSRHRNPYEASKAQAEVLVENFCTDGREALIVRPSIVIGPPDLQGTQISDLCQRALWHAVHRGEREIVLRLPEHARLNLVALRWVVDVLHAVSRTRAPRRGVFHLTAPHDVQVRDLVVWLARQGTPLNVVCAPDAAVAELPPASRLLDRVLDEVRDYFVADQAFDRSRLRQLVPPALAEARHDLDALLGNGLPMDDVPTRRSPATEHPVVTTESPAPTA